MTDNELVVFVLIVLFAAWYVGLIQGFILGSRIRVLVGLRKEVLGSDDIPNP